MERPTQVRDIVVIGSSAGGVEALPRVVQQLPIDLAASVFVVQHLAPAKNAYLVDILQRHTRLEVRWAERGERVERGRIVVAPPDVHLILADDHVMLARGARENHSRPSIDKLFRSAASTYGARAVGVLLTGMLDDGVAGLGAIRDAGGFVIVQDPEDAAFSDLPARALEVVRPDRVVPVDRVGIAIVEATRGHAPPHDVPAPVALEAALDRGGDATPADMERLGPQSAIACPECSGPTWQLGDEHSRRYRCYLGHVVSARTLLVQGAAQVESALWSAVRALNERALTLETLAHDAGKAGNAQSASYAKLAREARTHADLARQFVLDITQPS